MFYLTTHSTHFINGYMASDIWLRTILIARKETRCRHIGCSYRLAARVLLYAPSHRQDSTYHNLCYTSRGALAGMRNSSVDTWRIDPTTHRTMSERSTSELCPAHLDLTNQFQGVSICDKYSLISSASWTRLPVSSLASRSLSSPMSSRESLIIRSSLRAKNNKNIFIYLFTDTFNTFLLTVTAELDTWSQRKINSSSLMRIISDWLPMVECPLMVWWVVRSILTMDTLLLPASASQVV